MNDSPLGAAADFSSASRIFFDLGSTLIDESVCFGLRCEALARDTGVSLPEAVRTMYEYGRIVRDHIPDRLTFFGVPLAPWQRDRERPYPETLPLLDTLLLRGYRLGVIANQPPLCRERMIRWGVLPYFDVVLTSDAEGLEKPDPAFFRLALEQAACRPEEAVMIGDRLDNDIAPARALGLKTVRIRQGLYRLSEPRCAAETADVTLDSLAELDALFPGRK